MSIETIAIRKRSDGFEITTIEVTEPLKDKYTTYDVACLGDGCDWASLNTPDPDGDATQHLNKCEATGFWT